jgi:hypothetical protein
MTIIPPTGHHIILLLVAHNVKELDRPYDNTVGEVGVSATYSTRKTCFFGARTVNAQPPLRFESSVTSRVKL